MHPSLSCQLTITDTTFEVFEASSIFVLLIFLCHKILDFARTESTEKQKTQKAQKEQKAQKAQKAPKSTKKHSKHKNTIKQKQKMQISEQKLKMCFKTSKGKKVTYSLICVFVLAKKK